jgi:DNA-binding transcriptional LysR family regulator
MGARRKSPVRESQSFMDQLDAMTAFTLTVDAGSLSAAARKLGRSPASITRAVAALEQHLGVALLRRTTRSVKLTDAGERYLGTCRRVLADLAEAEQVARGGLTAPQGTLTVTAPATFGTRHVRPLVDAYLEAYPDVRARLLLLDRVVNLVDEGIDAAVRIAFLPDSALVAVTVGEVHRVVCASPAYCQRRGKPAEPRDLADHACIACTGVTPGDTWTFGAGPEGRQARHAKVWPTLTVNGVEAAIGSAVDGHGITCVLSYQVADELEKGTLVRLLTAYEPAPLPVHLVYPAGSIAAARVRAFVDLAVPRLREVLAPAPRGERRGRRRRG